MGIKKLGYLFFGLCIVMTASCCAAHDANILEARQRLKDYGLVDCLKRIGSSDSLLVKDLTLNSSSLHFMGRGTHQIIQNEETFETIHDPYKATSEYMAAQAPKLNGIMKNGQISKSYGCFQVYHSEAFNAFIQSQDQYVAK